MKQIMLIVSILLTIEAIAQTDQVRFRRCTSGCTSEEGNDPLNGNFNYGEITDWEEFETVDVVSDYSMRNCTQCTQWHKGVDYSSVTHGLGSADRGDALLAIEGGTISRLSQSATGNYIYLIINGNHDYGYGHLFYSSPIGESYLKSGKFIIKKCNIPNPNALAIIDLERCIAYSDVNDATVTIPGLTKCPNGQTVFTTTNHVNAGDEIGPIGDSGTPEPHLHLYNMKGNGTTIEASNTASPFENVLHSIPHYNLNLSTENNTNGITLGYPGTNAQTIKLRSTMANALISADRFTNVNMNINEVRLEMKKENESTFKTIKGGTYESRINLGATDASQIYPTVVSQRWGGWGTQGQRPYAYTEGANQPYDDFYFADFISRIHKNDVLAVAPIQTTDIPVNSKYNDGKYNLKPILVNVRDELFTETSTTFTLDNFQPFITDMKVMDGGIERTHVIRNQTDKIGSNNGIITINKDVNINAGSIFTPQIIIETSESLENLYIQWRQKGPYLFNDPLPMIPDAGRQKWTYNMNLLLPIEAIIRLTGNDYSGNSIMDVYNMTNQHTNTGRPVNIPVRRATNDTNNTPIQNQTDVTVWNHLPDPISNHKVGEDFFESDFQCKIHCENFRNENEDENRFPPNYCSYLDDVRETYSFNNSTCSTNLSLLGVNTDYFHVGWKDASGIYKLGEPIKEVFEPGYHCYIVESNNGCCSKEGCFYIENKLNIQPIAEQTLCDGGTIDLGIDPDDFEISWTYPAGTPIPEFYDLSRIEEAIANKYRYTATTNNGNCSVSGLIDISGYVHPFRTDDPVIASPCDGYGSIVFQGGDISGGLQPYSFEWSNGETTANLYDIESGNYTITISDANGCQIIRTYDVDNYDFYGEAIVENACVNRSNGLIVLLGLDENIYAEWDDNNNTIGNELLNIPAGTYCVNLFNEDCNTIQCFEVGNETYSTIVINTTVVHPCMNMANGEIALNISGGKPGYTYTWADNAVNGSNRTNLSPGVYHVTVTDACGYTSLKQITLQNNDVFAEAAENIACGIYENNVASIEVSAASDYEPLSYLWSNGSTASSISFNNSENDFGKYSVTITDSRGCNRVINDLDLDRTLLYDITGEKPCSGFDSGSITFEAHNPKQEPMSIFINGINLFTSNEESFLYTVQNLIGNTNYQIGYSTPSCSQLNYSNYFLGNRPTDKVYDHYDSSVDRCIYDEYCEGDLVGDDTYETTSSLLEVHSNYIRCSADYTCPNSDNEVVRNEGGTNIAVPAEVWYFFALLIEKANPGYFTQHTLDKYGASPKCKLIKVCDKTWQPSGFHLGNISFTGLLSLTDSEHAEDVTSEFELLPNGCIKGHDCHEHTWITCPDIVLNNLILVNNPIGEFEEFYNCRPKKLYLSFLLKYLDVIIQENPNNFVGSELHNHLQDFLLYYDSIQDPILKEEITQKLKCAQVSYCANGFNEVSNNIETIICGEFDHYETFELGDLERVYTCETKEFVDVNGDIVKVVFCEDGKRYMINKFIPLTKIKSIWAKTGSPGNYENPYTLIDADSIPGNFIVYGSQSYRNYKYPVTIIEKGGKKYFVKYDYDDNYSTYYELESNSVVHYYASFEDDEIVTLHENIRNKNYSWATPFRTSTRNGIFSAPWMTIDNFDQVNDTLIIKGRYTGSLTVEGITYLGTQSHHSHFSIFILKDGTYLHTKTIGNYEVSIAEGADVIYYQKGSRYYNIKKFNNYIFVPGYYYERLTIDTTYKIISVHYGSDDDLIFHLQGHGNLYNNNTISYSQNNDADVLVRINKNSQYIESFKISGADSIGFKSLNENIIGFVNYTSSLSLNNHILNNNQNNNNAQTLLLKFKNDNLYLPKISVQNAGSGLETKDIKLRGNLVFFGGNLNPTDSLALKVGRITYLADSSINTYPFSSYIFLRDFEDINQNLTDENFASRSETISLNNVYIYPNPSNKGYTIDLYSELEENVNLKAINHLGQVIFSDVLPAAKGNNRYYISESDGWPEGVYYFELNSVNINHTSKLIKIK